MVEVELILFAQNLIFHVPGFTAFRISGETQKHRFYVLCQWSFFKQPIKVLVLSIQCTMLDSSSTSIAVKYVAYLSSNFTNPERIQDMCEDYGKEKRIHEENYEENERGRVGF